jgi:hypothetical protein
VIVGFFADIGRRLALAAEKLANKKETYKLDDLRVSVRAAGGRVLAVTRPI